MANVQLGLGMRQLGLGMKLLNLSLGLKTGIPHYACFNVAMIHLVSFHAMDTVL